MDTSNRIKPGNIIVIKETAFCGPVYHPANYEAGERWGDDYTGYNPAAHGNIIEVQEEDREGRQRRVAVNGHFVEVGPWGPTRAQREEMERREAELRVKAAQDEEDAIARSMGVRFIRVEGNTVHVNVCGINRKATIQQIREAASDPWHPHLTPEHALMVESKEDRKLRLLYRSILRHAIKRS